MLSWHRATQNVTRHEGPTLIALAGPNGAGKSTVGPGLLRGALLVTEFVDADVIARGLSAFRPEAAAISAGRVMHVRLRELAGRRANFAFETTLAGRSHAIWVRSLLAMGYEFGLVFLWLPKADLAVERVQARVQAGGHAIPEDTVRRRYAAGLRNFFSVYKHLATMWRFYDNSINTGPRLIAAGHERGGVRVLHRAIWDSIREEWSG